MHTYIHERFICTIPKATAQSKGAASEALSQPQQVHSAPRMARARPSPLPRATALVRMPAVPAPHHGKLGRLSAAFVRLVLLQWGVHLAVSLAAEAALGHGQHDGSILRIVKQPRQCMLPTLL